MDLLLNVVFAWISVGLAFCLVIIWLLRVLNKSLYDNKNNFLRKINNSLRKYHIPLGIILIITSLAHGYYSSYDILSLNKGTISFIFIILLALTFIFKKKLVRFNGWIKWHRTLTVCFVVLFILHLVEVGGIVGYQKVKLSVISDLSGNKNSTIISNDNTTNSSSNNEVKTDRKYKDGEYIGEGTGYGPDLTVKVTIQDDKIEAIEIISHNERKSRYYQPAFDAVPKQIIETQSTDVDTVSGSTYSSKGIMEAVNDALSKAEIE